LGALSVIVKVPVLRPIPLGVKVTLIVQLLPDASCSPAEQVEVLLKLNSEPVITMVPMSRMPWPLFVNLTDEGADVVLSI
jgi:hypothetical protein